MVFRSGLELTPDESVRTGVLRDPAGLVGHRNLHSSKMQLLQERPLWVFFPLAFLLSWYPWLLSFLGVKAHGMNPLGVLLAALIVAAASGGWRGLKALLLRIVRVRVGWRWYAVAVLLPPAFVFLAFAL